MSVFNKFITILGWIAFIFICLIILVVIYILISNKIENSKRKKHLEKVRNETLVTIKQEGVHKTETDNHNTQK
ncbi:hypothetical protein J4455_02960 [Candidatus Woesearchaeota archaeon]|nr:hypothetical protein [Candidatus Woesearchaeota archaeon]